MKKFILVLILFLIFILFPSCENNDDKANEKIIETTKQLIELDWKLHNIKITYKEYKDNSLVFFIDEKTYGNHITNVLNPVILENVIDIDCNTVEKYSKLNFKDYDMISIKISRVYNDPLEEKKYIYLNVIIEPFSIQKIYDSGVVYSNTNKINNEERNIMIEFIKDKKNKWKINDYKGNSYLTKLKENLSTEYITKYKLNDNILVEYIYEFNLIN
ncbi:MAG: hypothetical protein ACOWWH_00150 [Eubacteriaceae bacterium]